jgi:hypothetical protein
MAALHTIVTRDLKINFYNKSFKVSDMATCVQTVNHMGHQDMRVVGHWLQSLVERGRNPRDWREHCAGQEVVLSDHKDTESWQTQEIAQLRAEIEELKIERLHK